MEIYNKAIIDSITKKIKWGERIGNEWIGNEPIQIIFKCNTVSDKRRYFRSDAKY